MYSYREFPRPLLPGPAASSAGVDLALTSLFRSRRGQPVLSTGAGVELVRGPGASARVEGETG